MSCNFDESPVSAAGCTAVRAPESAIEFETVTWISVKQRTWTAPPSTAAIKMELKAGSSHTGVVRADREAAGARLLKQARDMSDLYYTAGRRRDVRLDTVPYQTTYSRSEIEDVSE